MDNKGGHKHARETELENENDKLLSLLKNIQGSDDVNAEDITKWLANDEVNELTDNNIIEMVRIKIIKLYINHHKIKAIHWTCFELENITAHHHNMCL